jgi:hypothetical protein
MAAEGDDDDEETKTSYGGRRSLRRDIVMTYDQGELIITGFMAWLIAVLFGQRPCMHLPADAMHVARIWVPLIWRSTCGIVL